MEHSWGETKCRYCGAPRAILEREAELENYAYALIHTDNIKTRVAEIFGKNMQFDVIIGNPPYQMKGGAGGTSDSSIYHLFVEQAKKLEPSYLAMVIPSRWLAGGRGLDEFRKEMLNGRQLCSLVDFPDSGEAFPGVQIKGGVCYFLWNKTHQGACNVKRISGGEEHTQYDRELGEFDVFVRDERALGILRKVMAKKELPIISLVSGDTPFGVATNFKDWYEQSAVGMIPMYLIERGKRKVGFVKRDQIIKNSKALDCWKVLVPEAYGAGESLPHQILGKAIVAAPPSACTQSYLIVSPFSSETAARSFLSYYQTRFFRFIVSLRKITQHALRSTYSWVPLQAWDQEWTDQALYEKYGITEEEMDYIESVIRPMEHSTATEDE